MEIGSAAEIRALDLGPEFSTGPTELRGDAAAAVVAGSLVAFVPGESELHRQDVLQSLLLAQLAANAKAERHKDPAGWFRVYRSVWEQTAWVVEAGSTATRYLPQVSTFSASTVVRDAFRRRVAPEELAYVVAALDAFRGDSDGSSQFVFECPSHSGGIGNFQVVLSAEEEGVVSLRIAQVSFNVPKHVTRLMLEEFTNNAQFQVGFLTLIQNEELYGKIRSSIAAKVESRFAGAVVILPVNPAT
jgi:hypothetical protein